MKPLGSLLACSLLLFGGEAHAGGGWARRPHSLYVKLAGTTLASTAFHTSDGNVVRTADFNTQTIQLYMEYGVINRLSAILDAPVFKRAAYATASPASGIGDFGLVLKYAVLSGRFPTSLGIGAEFPTGNRRAFGANKHNPEARIFLPTGDGEFNTWLRSYVSHSFHPRPAFASVDVGYNLRTMGFTNQYQMNLQLGYRPSDAVWLFGGLRRLATAGTPRGGAAFSSIGIGEGVEYTSYGVGLSVEVAPHMDVTGDVSGGLGRAKNIYSGFNFGFGVAADLP